MNKKQKKMIICMLIIPTIITIVSLVISGLSLKEAPSWIVISIFVIIIVSPFTFLLVQNYVKRKQADTSGQKQKTVFLIASIVFILFAILLIILYHVSKEAFWINLFVWSPIFLIMLLIKYRTFFKS